MRRVRLFVTGDPHFEMKCDYEARIDALVAAEKWLAGAPAGARSVIIESIESDRVPA